MDKATVIQQFENVKVYKRGDKRAPHKPLLILYAIGALLRGRSRLLPFSEIDENLESLLSEFSSTGPPQGTNFPFWRLQNDGVWEVVGDDGFYVEDKKNPSKGHLVDYNVRGGFTEEVFGLLKAQTDLAFDIAQMMLDIHFSNEPHAKVLFRARIEYGGPRAS